MNTAKIENILKKFPDHRTPYELDKFLGSTTFTDVQKYWELIKELGKVYELWASTSEELRLLKKELEGINEKEESVTEELLETEAGNEPKGTPIEEPSTTPPESVDTSYLTFQIFNRERKKLGFEKELGTIISLLSKFKQEFTLEDIYEAQQAEYALYIKAKAGWEMESKGAVSSKTLESQYLIKEQGGNIEADIVIDNNKIFIGVLGDQEKVSIKKPEGYKIVTKSFVKKEGSYDEIVRKAKQEKAGYIFMIDSELAVPTDCLLKLFQTQKNIASSVVSGYYLPKDASENIIIDKGIKREVPKDNKVHEVTSIGYRCTLFPAEVFGEKKKEWFGTDRGTVKNLFTKHATETGHKLLVDSIVQCN